MHQAIVGLHQEEQPPRPREQTILRARQEDGQGLRKRPHQGFRHGQVPLRTLVLSVLNCQSTHSWLDNPILRWLAHLRIRKEISAQFSTQPRQRCLATLKYLIHPCL